MQGARVGRAPPARDGGLRARAALAGHAAGALGAAHAGTRIAYARHRRRARAGRHHRPGGLPG